MNRQQLDALLSLGLITSDQHAHALSTRTAFGQITERPIIDVTMAVAEPVETTPASRTITGTISVYEHYITSHGMILHTGSLEPRMPLSRVKMLRDHNHSDPVGYMTAFDPATLSAEFAIAEGENGDRALTEAAPEAKLRDGLSVGFTCIEYDFDDEWTLHVYRAELYEVSLCAIPAIPDAGVTSVAAALATSRKETPIMNRAQLAAALAAGTITQAEHDAQLAALPAAPAPAAVAAIPAEFAAGPAPAPEPTQRLEVRDRPMSLAAVTQRLAGAIATHNPQQVHLALQDMLPADDAGNAWLGRADWIGEIWQATRSGRPWIESFGQPRPLTATKIKGFRWVDRPKPAKYTGNKTDVPSNKPKTEPVEATPTRWAGGWDIDRIFWDLGDPQFLNDFWVAALSEYQRDSDADVAATTLAAATPLALPFTTVLGGIAGVATQLRSIGANVDNIWLAEDLFEQYAELKIADLPAWIANATGGVSLREGTADVGDLKIAADPSLDDGTITAYDKRAATVYEGPEVRVEAQNIPKGGIDLGFFNYGGVLVNDARAIVTAEVDETP